MISIYAALAANIHVIGASSHAELAANVYAVLVASSHVQLVQGVMQ